MLSALLQRIFSLGTQYINFQEKFSDLCPNLLNPYVDSQREQQTISCQERKKMVHLEILQLVLLPSWTLTRISTTATTLVEGFGIYKAASFSKIGLSFDPFFAHRMIQL